MKWKENVEENEYAERIRKIRGHKDKDISDEYLSKEKKILKICQEESRYRKK